MRKTQGAILVITHSRAVLLEELFQNLENLIGFESTPLIVVRQVEFESVNRVIESWRPKINILIETDGSADTVAKNISRNRFSGYSVGFQALQVDWILAVEEDVLLAKDALNFSQQIMDRHISSKNFRAINLGSRLLRSELGLNSYAHTRFGLFGPASVLPKTTWAKMQRLGVLSNRRNEHWDAAFEAYIKTGLTIAPNNSRYVDRGWSGTHTPAKDLDKYFSDLENSFVGLDFYQDQNYKRLEMGYNWRKDLRKFKSIENPIFWLIFAARNPVLIEIYRKIFKGF